MSADNWAKCPRCVQEATKNLDAAQARVDASYGQVSVEEFDQMRAGLATERSKVDNDNSFRTFREDYEIYGADDGVVTVSYRGGCTVCKLELKFKDDHPIMVKPKNSLSYPVVIEEVTEETISITYR